MAVWNWAPGEARTMPGLAGSGGAFLRGGEDILLSLS
jgi:hypothetical protein